MAKTKDLTDGSILKCILAFSIPLFFGMLFQQFYNLFDSIIVGNTLGQDALGGVGATGSINFMIIGLCNGVSAGCALPVAQAFGAKDYKQLRKFVVNTIYLGVIFCLVLTLISCIFCKDFLKLLGTLPENMPYAYDYIFYILLGIPITFAYNATSNIIRSLGDSKTPVYILLGAIILNVGLDCLFLIGMHLGVKFAAIATVISQAVSAIACLIVIITKYDILKIQKDEWKFERKYISRLLYMGLPMGLQYSITAIGSITLTAAINGLGSPICVAGQTAGNKLSCFCSTPFDALGATMATFGGQNVGAKKYNRLTKGLTTASLIGFIYSAFIWVVIFFFGRNLASLFFDEPSKEVIDAAYQYILIMSSFYILLTLVNVVRFMIQGMGFSAVSLIAGVMEMLGRGGVALIFVRTIGYTAVCFASPCAWLLADAFLIPCFIVTRNKLIKKENSLAPIDN